MKSFLFGVGVGTAVGLLIAPQAGKKTRAEAQDLGLGPERSTATNEVEMYRAKRLHERTTEQEMTPAVEATAESEAVAKFLNTAKRDEFMEVPGIGRATAKRIIKNRPYEPETEVLEKRVLSEATSEQVKEQFVDKDRDVA